MFFAPLVGGTWAGWWYLVGVSAIVSLIFIGSYLVYRDDKRRARLRAHYERCDLHKQIMNKLKDRKKRAVLAVQQAFDSQIDVRTFYGDGR